MAKNRIFIKDNEGVLTVEAHNEIKKISISILKHYKKLNESGFTIEQCKTMGYQALIQSEIFGPNRMLDNWDEAMKTFKAATHGDA